MNTIDQTTDIPLVAATSSRSPYKLGAAGLLFAVVPLFFTITQASYRTENGVVVGLSYHDYGALICGFLTAVVGIMAVTHARRRARPMAPIAFAVLVVLVGALQIARGFGLWASVT